jgi:sec-independent protein translocase protein TatC
MVQDGHDLRMGFMEHLVELRNRIFVSSLALAIGTAIGFAFAAQVIEFMRIPFCNLANECRFQTIDPTDGVMIYFRVSLLIGGIIAMPIISYQFMAFVIPGLTDKERRVLFFSLPAIVILFLLGVAFSWLILVPPALSFLNGFLPNIFRPDWTADGYFSFTTSLVFWMGVAFEAPLVVFVLALLGVVNAGSLAKNWRVAIVIASIAAALITPTVDPVNMSLVMGPLLILYLISILLASLGSRINQGQRKRS